MIALRVACSIQRIDEQSLGKWMERLLELDVCVPAERWEELHFRHPMPDKWELSRMAMTEGRLVGYMIASRKPLSLHVHRIVVDPEVRGHGIGRVLLCELASDAQKRRIGTITLKVARGNESATRFYGRLGFRTVSADDDNLSMAVNAGGLLVDGC